MKKKLNPELLKEELKKFRLLSEYDFYQDKKEAPEYKDLDEADDKEPDDLKPVDDNTGDVDAAANAVAGDLGVDGDDDTETTGTIPEPDSTDDTSTNDSDETETADTPAPVEPAGNEEEIDVTALVKGSEDAKLSADHASHNTEMLLHKLENLEAHVAKMEKIGDKIENLEKEIIKRNPTPVEKLEMRSLDSYPYSQKLTDFWADKKGAYDVMGNEKKKEEYVLTKDDVDTNYSDSDIKKSFTVKNKDYDEEDVDDFDEHDV